MLSQVDVQQEVVLHLVQELETLPVAGVVEALHHLPQLGLQLQEQLGRKHCQLVFRIRIHFIQRSNSWTRVFCSMLFTVPSTGGFQREPNSFLFFKILTKKYAKQENSSLFLIFLNKKGKQRVETRQKTRV